MQNNKKTILIIDDEASLRNVLHNKLEKEGFTVLTAQDGKEGWEKVCQKPDLVLMDLMLPEIPGEKILKLMNEKGLIKEIPVIILSVKGDDANMQNCLKILGAKDYLVKSDYTLNEILKKINKYIG